MAIDADWERSAEVIGEVWGTRKSPLLDGRRLLLVGVEGADRVMVAIDTLDAREGQKVLVAVGSWVRGSLAERPLFQKALADAGQPKAPVVDAIRERPGGIVIGAGLRVAENISFYVVTTFGREWSAITRQPVPLVSLNGSILGLLTPEGSDEVTFEELAAWPLSQAEVNCVDQALRARNSNLWSLVQRGIGPSDRAAAELRAICRGGTNRTVTVTTTGNYQASPSQARHGRAFARPVGSSLSQAFRTARVSG